MIANIVLENPKYIYKNFSGNVTDHNIKGARNFSVLLNKEIVEAINKDDWNIKYLKNKNNNDPIPYLKVFINYKYINKPEIFVKSVEGKTLLAEDQIHILDKIDIKKSKLIIRSYKYETLPTNVGIIAYLKSLEIEDLFISSPNSNAISEENVDKKELEEGLLKQIELTEEELTTERNIGIANNDGVQVID